MDINKVDKNIVFKILKRNPEKIEILSKIDDSDYYKEACKIALRIDGSLIRYISCEEFEKNLDEYFKLTEIAQKSCVEIDRYSTVLNAMVIENRLFKSRLIKN